MKIKEKNKVYILLVVILIVIVAITSFFIKYKDGKSEYYEYYEPLRENVTFLAKNKSKEIKIEKEENEFLDFNIDKYTFNKPYYKLNPFINNNIVLIAFKTNNSTSIEVLVENDSYNFKRKYIKSEEHYILARVLEGENTITLIDDNNKKSVINVKASAADDLYITQYIDSKIIFYDYDDAGYIRNEYIFNDDYYLFSKKDNNVLALSKEQNIVEFNNKGTPLKTIKLKDMLQFKTIQYLNYNPSNESIDLTIDNRRYEYKDQLVEVNDFKFDEVNELENYQFSKFKLYDFSYSDFTNIQYNDVSAFKDATLKEENFKIINNILINSDYKKLVFISPRGYAYRSNNVYINLNNLPKGKYFIYFEDDMSYNSNRYIIIK